MGGSPESLPGPRPRSCTTVPENAGHACPEPRVDLLNLRLGFSWDTSLLCHLQTGPVKGCPAAPYRRDRPTVWRGGGSEPCQPQQLAAPHSPTCLRLQQPPAALGPTWARPAPTPAPPPPPGCAPAALPAPGKSCPLTRQLPPSDRPFPCTNQFVSTEGRELQSKQIMHAHRAPGMRLGAEVGGIFLPPFPPQSAPHPLAAMLLSC